MPLMSFLRMQESQRFRHYGRNDRGKKEAEMPYNVLIVDDDKDFRDEFRDYLENYEVIEASNGEEALELLRKPNEIDLVILEDCHFLIWKKKSN